MPEPTRQCKGSGRQSGVTDPNFDHNTYTTICPECGVIKGVYPEDTTILTHTVIVHLDYPEDC